MKKYKFILPIAVLILFVSVFCISLTTSALTQEEINAFLEEKDKTCNKKNLYEKYNLQLEKVAGKVNTFRISVKGTAANTADAEFRVTDVRKGEYGFNISTLPVITKDAPLELEIKPVKDFLVNDPDLFDDKDSIPEVVDENDNAVMVVVRMTSSKDGCLGINDEHYGGDASQYKYKGSFWTVLEYKNSGEPIIGTVQNGATTEANTNIGEGKACTNFINGVYNEDQFNSASNAVIKKADFEKYNYSVVNDEGKKFYNELLIYCFKDTVTRGTNYTEAEITNMIADGITTWKAYSSTANTTSQTFDEAFTEIYNNSQTNGKFMPLGSSVKLDYKSTPNYCDWKKHEPTTNADGTTDYYVNKDYYYAEKNEGTETATYTYNYAPGDTETVTVNVCSKICKEAVKVEYGPPEASKAGLCFEYKVKVTSYVKCESTTPENPPEPDKPYCLPAPWCYNKYLGWIRQAGPNEEFESCVEKCDGGKYTQACSLACYNKVYGKQKNKKRLSYETKIQAKQMAYEMNDCKSANADGCYYWSGDEIKWNAGTHSYGRWYYEVGWNITDSRYRACENGIKRQILSNGGLCTDTCSWTGCTKGQYLNLGTATEDYTRNLEEYKAAVTKCKASATCSKKTATFTIAVKYDTADDKGNITVNKVYYPYTSSSQKVTNPKEGADEYKLKDKDTFKDGVGYKNDLSTIIDYNGCYATADNKRWYLTEWGFPGTYINNKTGEISFGEPEDMSGWYLENEKFCMPLNAKSVNKLWWEWKVIGNHCISDEQIEKELQGTPGTSNGYNIEAIVNDFGYFGWDFKVNCFYAVRNEECVPDESKCCAPPGGSGTTQETKNYVLRTVDRSNMFPNSGYDVTDEQRRTVGFNWTEGASILSLKNTQYHVNPEELRDKIQKGSEALYTEAPDYQFYLTPSDLSKLRQYNKRNGYDDWNGRSSIINGVHTYESNLFRAVGTEANIIDGSAVKATGTPGINNE